MKKAFFQISLLAFFILFGFGVYAQDSGIAEPEMADGLRTDGKIYVVVLVVSIVFTGLVAFLIHTERKVRNMEKEIEGIKGEKSS